MIKRIESKDGEPILIRPFCLTDFRRFHQMNSSISPDTRRAYRAPMPQPRPPIRQMRRLVLWGLIEVKLAMSSIGFLRQFLTLMPRMAYIAFVAVNPKDEIVGFTFFNIVGRRAKHRCIAEAGEVLTDDYQGRGVGEGLSAASLEMVDDEVLLVFVEIYEWNQRMIRIVERQGYRRLGTYRDQDGEAVWLGARGREVGQLPLEGARPSSESSTNAGED